MPALLAILRAAIPFMATLFGGYVLSDVFNERMLARQNQQKADLPTVVKRSYMMNKNKWGFFAAGSALIAAVVVIISKRLR